MDTSRLGLGQRLFSTGPHSAVGALGKVRMQVLRSSGTFPGVETQLESDNTKLLCPEVPGHLWREHSLRAFLPSCTGCLKYQDTVGGLTRATFAQQGNASQSSKAAWPSSFGKAKGIFWEKRTWRKTIPDALGFAEETVRDTQFGGRTPQIENSGMNGPAMTLNLT